MIPGQHTVIGYLAGPLFGFFDRQPRFDSQQLVLAWRWLCKAAVCQTHISHGNVLRRPCAAVLQAQSVLLLHELVFTILFFVGALVQAAFMYLQPKQYNAARQHIALANRCARLYAGYSR